VTVYSGPELTDGVITLRAPDPADLRQVTPAPDVDRAFRHWLAAAYSTADVNYFGLYLGNRLAGQILLHNIDVVSCEALIAYHLFDPALRGHGYGSRAVILLVSYLHTSNFARVFIITSRDNIASQRIAEKSGFAYAGPSREDPVSGMVFVLNLAPK
jgi:RimJ/RimL family protein N-acetyltransferase